MKNIKLIITALFCISCKNLPSTFVQDNLLIVAPATQIVGKNGEIVELAFNDGGTKMIRIVDASGKIFEVYIDHRMGKEANWGAIYINSYPQSAGSIRVINVSRFKKCFSADLKY